LAKSIFRRFPKGKPAAFAYIKPEGGGTANLLANEFFEAPASSGITGVAASSQAQANTAIGAASPQAISGTGATSQAQTVASDGSFAAAAGISGSVVTSQAQTASLSGSVTVPAVTGTLTTSQAQTTALAGNASPATVSGTGTASQGQTSAASGSFAGSSGVSGVASTSQGQTVSSSGSVINPDLAGFNGGFVMRKRKVYVKRGKQYLIFNNNEEADSYLAAEKAIETAKKSSRGAAKRVIKALKVVKPEIAPEPKLEELSALIAKFDFKYDLPQLAKNNDIEALYHIQSMLYALQQDEEDIELLLLAL
jgi:hypothetical protein